MLSSNKQFTGYQFNKKSCLPCSAGSQARRVLNICYSQTLQPSQQSAFIPTQVLLKTKPTCELAVSIFPTFSYNAVDGGGQGSVTDIGNGFLRIDFDATILQIPDLSYKTTSIMGIPMPPPLNIAIRPLKFQGVLNTITGQMDMEFDAQFNFTVGPLYRAPSLLIQTTMTTERSTGAMKDATGERLRSDGSVKLVGVARVPKTGDLFVDTFLLLPTDALASMDAELQFY